jgi:hypothetical protein
LRGWILALCKEEGLVASVVRYRIRGLPGDFQEIKRHSSTQTELLVAT